MKNKILLVVLIFPLALWGQVFFPFKYRIIQGTEPDKYILLYTEKNTDKEDSILLVVDNACSNYNSFTIICPDTAFHAEFFNTDSMKVKYYSNFKIRQEMVHPDDLFDIKDTGITCCISQITIVLGRHYQDMRIIYSRFPLSRKKIRSIKEYVYGKGSEPMCIKRKNCKISLPQL